MLEIRVEQQTGLADAEIKRLVDPGFGVLAWIIAKLHPQVPPRPRVEVVRHGGQQVLYAKETEV